jgi:N-acetylglutamate synthase-like GNAT family acetyltransferase
MRQTLTLRKARPDDLSAIDRLLARSYPRLLAADYPPSVLVTAVPRLIRARPELIASGRYYVVEDGDGLLLGAGGWSMARGAGPGESGVAEVRHVATDPSATRRGVASAVVAFSMAQAGAGGARRMDCLSTRTAVPFYRRMGFRALGSTTVPLAPGIAIEVERMSRQLDD